MLFFAAQMPAQIAASLAGLIITFIYSSLAGFSLPTERACLMLSFVLLMIYWRRKIISWTGWSIALLIVLLINPLSVLTESFWLSFGSVAFIIYGVSARLSSGGWWWKYCRLQWVITLGLIPMSVALFQQYAVISLAANCIAIPVVGFLILPLILIGTFSLFLSNKLAAIFWGLADHVLSVLWKVLVWFAHLKWAVWYQSTPIPIVCLAVIGVLLLLLPQGFPGRWIGLIWLLPLLLYQPSLLSAGNVKLTLLDVGQGLLS